MADEVKKVGIEWQVKYDQLKKVQTEQTKYINNMKKMHQVQKSVVGVSKSVDQGFARQAQQLQLLSQGMAHQSQETQQYLQVLAQLQMAGNQIAALNVQNTAAIAESVSATNQSTEATNRNTEAKNRQSQALKKGAINWYSNIRTLALYAIGAASVYRLIMKLRRALTENVRIVFEQTEEYQDMLKAQDNLKGSIVAFLGTDEDWKRYFDKVSDFINRLAEGLIYLAATAEGVKTYIEAISEARKAGEMKYPGIPGVDAAEQVAANQQAAAEAAEQAMDAFIERFQTGMREMREHSDLITENRENEKEAFEGLTDEQKKYQAYLEDLIQAEERRIRDLIDLFEEYERKIRDIALATQRAMEDLALAGARKREDIETAYLRKLEDIEASQQDRRAAAEEKYRLKLIQIEMRYREKLIQIEENFQDAMYDAISKRDATAALRAIRRRSRDEGRAKRERDNARTMARLNYESQIRDQERALERMRQDAERARQRQLDDMRRDQERKRQDILRDQERELADLETHFQRTQDDIEAQYQWEIDKATAHYTQDEKAWNDHLNRKLSTLQNTYAQMMAQHSLLMGVLSQPLPAPGVTRTTRGGPGRTHGLAEGGMIIASQPTNITVGEGRYTEAVMAVPIAPSAREVNYSGKLNHQISGQVGAALQGFEGRVGAMLTRQVIQVMGEMLN